MYFIGGQRIALRTILDTDINLTYLGWLNDPEVNLFSGRRKSPARMEDIHGYLKSLPKDASVLAICTSDSDKHIGNIKYGPVDWPNRCSEIEILIGDKTEWNKGYATEAIYLLTDYLFHTLNLNRVEAKSANPAFIKCVTSHLGWKVEGELREKFFIRDMYVNYILMSLLKSEFKTNSKYLSS